MTNGVAVRLQPMRSATVPSVTSAFRAIQSSKILDTWLEGRKKYEDKVGCCGTLLRHLYPRPTLCRRTAVPGMGGKAFSSFQFQTDINACPGLCPKRRSGWAF